MARKRKMWRKGFKPLPDPAVYLKERKIVMKYERKDDYLKYLKVARMQFQRKHKMKLGDLEILLYIYSEKLFTKDQFKEYSFLFSWNKKRMKMFLERGYIRVWRKRNGIQPTLYTMTTKGSRMIGEFYKHCSGEARISENKHVNPIFKKNNTFNDRMVGRYVKKMNKEYGN